MRKEDLQVLELSRENLKQHTKTKLTIRKYEQLNSTVKN
jgi:hypothetical protein